MFVIGVSTLYAMKVTHQLQVSYEFDNPITCFDNLGSGGLIFFVGDTKQPHTRLVQHARRGTWHWANDIIANTNQLSCNLSRLGREHNT